MVPRSLNATQPKRIVDEGARVRGHKGHITRPEFFSGRCKGDREWLTLSYLAEIMSRAGRTCPQYALQRNDPEPDFHTYLDLYSYHRRVEITEVLRPGRRRHADYKEAERGRDIPWPLPPHPTPWRSFAGTVRKKLVKHYARGAWLVIYHNMSEFDFRSTRDWHELVLGETRSWKSDSDDTCDLTRSTYENVFVIHCSGTGLVRLYPNWDVIHEGNY